MNLRRLRAMVKKEVLQVRRDPSALLIAFVLPPVLLLFFSFGVSLDVKNVGVGVVLESDGPHARDLAAAYQATPYMQVTTARHRNEFARDLVTGDLSVFVVIPQDFDARVNDSRLAPQIQIIADGSQPSSANFTAGYARGVFSTWLAGVSGEAGSGPDIRLEQRFWFNPELESRQVLVPGAIALVMTIIGTMLTAMVIAREWERGTMEALMSTSAGIAEILISKLLPYFLLGMFAVLGCAFLAVTVLDVPLRGSLGMLMLVGAVFLIPALGQGLLISTLASSQFHAAETGLITGFLPALLLSGFIFEIQSMPVFIQWITQLIPARYFVAALQTVFLAGDVWSDIWPNLLSLLALGALLFGITIAKSRRGLD